MSATVAGRSNAENIKKYIIGRIIRNNRLKILPFYGSRFKWNATSGSSCGYYYSVKVVCNEKSFQYGTSVSENIFTRVDSFSTLVFIQFWWASSCSFSFLSVVNGTKSIFVIMNRQRSFFTHPCMCTWAQSPVIKFWNDHISSNWNEQDQTRTNEAKNWPTKIFFAGT